MRNRLGEAGRWCVLVACTLLVGCATYGHALRDIDLAVQQGRPGDALSRLESLNGGAGNEALYLINKGMLLRLQGDIAGSVAAFEAAKPLVSYLEAASISETAGRLVVAEGTSSYQPRPFERLQLHVMQALNQLELGNWDGARVEALQMDLLLQRVYNGEAPQGGDAFARYLSGIIFEGLNERDQALVSYRKAMHAYQASGHVVHLPEDLELRLLMLTEELGLREEYEQYAKRFGAKRVEHAKELAAHDGKELVVIAATGLVPRRYETSALHQDFTSGKFYRISLPALHRRSGSGARAVVLNGTERLGQSQPVESLAVAAERALESEMPGLVARSIARNIAKNRIANEAGRESAGLEILVNFASAVLENADVRSWSTLPESFHLVRVPLSYGSHEALVAEVQDRGGRMLVRRELEELKISSTTRPRVVAIHWVSN